MPRWITLSLALLAALSLVPFACIASSRATRSSAPRIHLVQDMDNQPRFKSQQANPLFADRRAMRPPVSGTLSHGGPVEAGELATGRMGAEFVMAFPVPVTEALVRRGGERFGIYCAPCHGLAGFGDGIVAARADRLQEGTWVPPSSLHTEAVRAKAVGDVFNTITNGMRTMPAYGPQIPASDRWAIVAYVRALELSQNARIEDVPPERRAGLR